MKKYAFLLLYVFAFGLGVFWIFTNYSLKRRDPPLILSGGGDAWNSDKMTRVKPIPMDEMYYPTGNQTYRMTLYNEDQEIHAYGVVALTDIRYDGGSTTPEGIFRPRLKFRGRWKMATVNAEGPFYGRDEAQFIECNDRESKKWGMPCGGCYHVGSSLTIDLDKRMHDNNLRFDLKYLENGDLRGEWYVAVWSPRKPLKLPVYGRLIEEGENYYWHPTRRLIKGSE